MYTAVSFWDSSASGLWGMLEFQVFVPYCVGLGRVSGPGVVSVEKHRRVGP